MVVVVNVFTFRLKEIMKRKWQRKSYVGLYFVSVLQTNKQTYSSMNANYMKEINSHVSEMVNQRKLYSIKLVILGVGK